MQRAPLSFLVALGKEPDFREAVGAIAAAFSLASSVETGEGGMLVASFSGGREVIARAMTRLGLSDDGLDPAADNDYQLFVGLEAPNEDWPTPRALAPADAGDNWAAWAFVEAIMASLRDALGGVDVTGDPPPFLLDALSRHVSMPARVYPALALRVGALLPRNWRVLQLASEATQAVGRRLLARGEGTLFVLLDALDPRGPIPDAPGACHPIGTLARLLRSYEMDDGINVVVVALRRVDVVGGTLEEVEVSPVVDTDELAADELAELLRAGEARPILWEELGVARRRELGTLGAGDAIDVLAEAACAQLDDCPAALHILRERRVAERARALLPLLARCM